MCIRDRTDLLCFCAVGVTRLYYTKEVFFSSIVAIAFSFSTGLAGGCQYKISAVLLCLWEEQRFSIANYWVVPGYSGFLEICEPWRG